MIIRENRLRGEKEDCKKRGTQKTNATITRTQRYKQRSLPTVTSYFCDLKDAMVCLQFSGKQTNLFEFNSNLIYLNKFDFDLFGRVRSGARM